MKTAEVQSLVGRVAAVDADCTDSAVVRAAVGELRQLRSWVDGREVALARLLAGSVVVPGENVVRSRPDLAARRAGDERAETAEQMPGGRGSRWMPAGCRVVMWTCSPGACVRCEPAVRDKLIEGCVECWSVGEQVAADEFARTGPRRGTATGELT